MRKTGRKMKKNKRGEKGSNLEGHQEKGQKKKINKRKIKTYIRDQIKSKELR